VGELLPHLIPGELYGREVRIADEANWLGHL
jgi:hypothetical protein